jgi:ribosome maturation factor RimP
VFDMSAGDRVREVIEPLLTGRGIEVIDVEHARGTLRVTIDRVDGAAIDLDTVAAASELVSGALDRADPIPGRYTLEVSSPGVERPLRTPAHFRRHVGATVAVKTRAGTEGERRITGTLDAADAAGVTVAGRRVAYADIERARTVFEWGPAPKRAGARKAAAR